MEKGNVLILAQLLASMKEAAARLATAVKSNDAENVASIKKEILALQAKVGGLL
ncbi:MAG TPA: hypothetical protein VJK03_02395 [Candidatus Nanoarchaeia archaeon]|nr:hypothetical protein [Candidatus Nanoarchaeia archaeon]